MVTMRTGSSHRGTGIDVKNISYYIYICAPDPLIEVRNAQDDGRLADGGRQLKGEGAALGAEDDA